MSAGAGLVGSELPNSDIIDPNHGDHGVELLCHSVLLVLGAPCQLLVLAGPERSRTIPLPVIGVWSPQVDLI
jgi:hypothetical protein